MEEKKYQIFISSTYTDLIDERDKIIETLLGIYHLPVGMEMFSAGNQEQWEIIKETIATSDYYILILGHRYGSMTEGGISYTEQEYDYALKLNKPILSFVKYRDTPTSPVQRESNTEKIRKLDLFYKKVTSNKMCDFWENKDELSTKVAIALPKAFRRNPQVGWIRGDQAISSEVSKELVLLSKTNRELTKELEDLRKKIIKRSPKLELTINNNSRSYEYILEKQSESYLNINTEYDYSDIPDDLKNYITKSEIEKYKKSLPNEETIDLYEEKINYYYNLIRKKPISQLSFKVCNRGSLKAKEVYVVIKFPNELLVVKNSKIDDIEKPDVNLPQNPINIAEDRKKKEEERRKISEIGSSLLKIGEHDLMRDRIMGAVPQKFPTASEINKNYWVSHENNEITIKLTSLLHTKCRVFDNKYSILPKKQGTFDIHISIISEELEVQIQYVIPAIIK